MINNALARSTLLFFLLVFSLFVPSLADIPVDPEVERQHMQRRLDTEIQGLDHAQQVAKVKEMIAEISIKKSANASELNGPSNSGGIPPYMRHKQNAGLTRYESFLKQWLVENDKTTKSGKSSHERSQDATVPPFSSSSPLTPGLALGGLFLLGGILLGAKRALAPTQA